MVRPRVERVGVAYRCIKIRVPKLLSRERSKSSCHRPWREHRGKSPPPPLPLLPRKSLKLAPVLSEPLDGVRIVQPNHVAAGP